MQLFGWQILPKYFNISDPNKHDERYWGFGWQIGSSNGINLQDPQGAYVTTQQVWLPLLGNIYKMYVAFIQNANEKVG